MLKIPLMITEKGLVWIYGAYICTKYFITFNTFVKKILQTIEYFPEQ